MMGSVFNKSPGTFAGKWLYGIRNTLLRSYVDEALLVWTVMNLGCLIKLSAD